MSGSYRSSHVDSVTAEELTAYIKSIGGVLIGQEGSHVSYRVGRARVGSLIHGDIPRAMMRRNAEVLGFSYPELRARMGKPLVNASRPKRAQRTVSVTTGPTKSEVLETLEEIKELARTHAAFLAQGQRDPALYRRFFEAAVVARRALADMSVNGQVAS